MLMILVVVDFINALERGVYMGMDRFSRLVFVDTEREKHFSKEILGSRSSPVPASQFFWRRNPEERTEGSTEGVRRHVEGEGQPFSRI
jgi:hypothetical protein